MRNKGFCSIYCEGSRSSTQIKKLLEEEGLYTSRITVWKFLRNFKETKCLSRREGSGRPTKITPQIKAFVEETMKEDDETTAVQLHKKLLENGFSISTILRCRKELSWTFRGMIIRYGSRQMLAPCRQCILPAYPYC